jgi:ferric-dicitrate binding protein FerR (iron transport regulator)
MAEHFDDIPPLDLDAFCERLADRTGVEALRAAPSEPIPSPTVTRPRFRGVDRVAHSRFRSIGAIGATVAAAAVLLVAGWWTGTHRVGATLSTARSVYTTDNGERATIKLPDGSQVVLNVASRLEVPADYATGHRVLKLDGEAFFTVAHQGASPFTVVAGPSTTRVLGTRFVVRHYRTDTSATVAVFDGKVAAQSVVLSAQQSAEVRPNAAPVVRAAEPGQFTFASGVLTLPNLPLSRAAVELARWYDADIRFGDAKLGNRRIYGAFSAGSLADLTEYLQTLYNIRVVRDGRTLTLYAK